MSACSPPTPGCVSAEFLFTSDGQVVENVFHLMRTGATQPTLAEMTTLAAHLEQQYVNLRYVGDAKRVLNTVKVRDLTPGTGGQVVIQPKVTADPAGRLSGACPPNNVAFAVKIATNNGGRGGRGRLYEQGFTNADITGSTLSAARANTIVSELQAFRAAIEGSDPFKFGVLSKWLNKVCRPAGNFQQMTVFAYTDLNLDSQRRRLPGRGK